MEEALKQRVLKMMAKAWRKLDSAKKNHAQGLYEDATSRAYYAMFHAARALLLTKHVEAKTHSGVIAMLHLHFIREGILDRECGRKMTYCRDLRENGDYGLDYEPDSADSEAVIADAEGFVKTVARIVG